MPVVISIFFLLFIVFVTCYNILDKWRFRADRQYPYVREYLEEWESVTLRLLAAAGLPAPEGRVSGQTHPWKAVSAANALAAACPPRERCDGALLARQGELEEELDTFLQVYNGLVASYNKALGRPVIRQLAPLFRWTAWEELNFNPEPVE